MKIQKKFIEKDQVKFWNQVNLQAQEKIYHLLTTTLPLQNIPLITQNWKFEDKQMKLTGLFLDRDTDYRTLLADVENQYQEEEEELLPDKEAIAEEIAVYYFQLVFKSLIGSLSDYVGYDPAYFKLDN